MPIDLSNYPETWPTLSRYIRFIRAGAQCECRGECGINHGGDDGADRCQAMHGQKVMRWNGAAEKLITIILTTAHLWQGPCDCGFKCDRLEHLKAFCQLCHLNYDTDERTANARATRQLKKDKGRPLIKGES